MALDGFSRATYTGCDDVPANSESGMIAIKALAILLITGVTVLTFVTDPPLAAMQSGGGASRLFYFHVPIAQVSFLSFMTAAVFAILFLRRRRPDDDHLATASAEIGLIFCVVALVTGSLWAKQAWGAYWNWDPRQLFLFALILFYGAFFALRQATTNVETKRRLSAVYLIFGGAIAPFLFFVLPRLYQSLHEDANEVVMSAATKPTMSPQVATIFGASTLGFLLLYIWLLRIGLDAARMEESRAIEQG